MYVEICKHWRLRPSNRIKLDRKDGGRPAGDIALQLRRGYACGDWVESIREAMVASRPGAEALVSWGVLEIDFTGGTKQYIANRIGVETREMMLRGFAAGVCRAYLVYNGEPYRSVALTITEPSQQHQVTGTLEYFRRFMTALLFLEQLRADNPADTELKTLMTLYMGQQYIL